MKIEKTVNDTAIFLNVFEGEDKGDIRQFIDFNNLEKNVIIFDFTKTRSINSAFIAELISVYEECVAKNVKFVISGINDLTKSIFECIGVNKVLKNT